MGNGQERASPIRLRRLQYHLERLYEVTVPHDVDDFLITDSTLASNLDNGDNARSIDEKLLLVQEGDSLDLALYLDEDVLRRLGENNPHDRLHIGNLADFCTVLEGVSHFLYLTWNAAFNRSVTHLELEMQAEVDKYILIIALMGRQRQGQVPARLHHWLFGDPRFDMALTEAELIRYREANRYAGKYCLHLQNRYLRTGGAAGTSMINDLRRFYRLRLHDKIRRIDGPF
jgi:hypothetical protein